MEINQQYEVEYLDYIPPAWSKRKHKYNNNELQMQSLNSIVTQKNNERQLNSSIILINQKLDRQQDYKKGIFEIRQGQTFEQIAKQMEQEQRHIKEKQSKKLESISNKQSKNITSLTPSHQKTHINKQDLNGLSIQRKNITAQTQQLRFNKEQNDQGITTNNRQLATSEQSIQNRNKSKYSQIKIDYCNCQIILSQKNIKQCTADVLFIPFQTHNFQYYPGSVLKHKLEKQREKIAKAELFEGSIYIKNKHEVPNFKYLVFLKVQNNNFSSAFSKGMSSLLAKSKKDKMQINQILFCLQENQIKINDLIRGISVSKQLKIHSQIKVNISINKNMDIEAICKQIEGILLNGSD